MRRFLYICAILVFVLSWTTSSGVLVQSSFAQRVQQKEPIQFLGFEPDDAHAKIGLDYIYAGRAFRPNGLPLSLVSNLYSLRRLTGRKHIDLFAGKDQLRVFGKLPSPPSRTFGRGNGGRDYTLSNSILELQTCYDDQGKQITDFYPSDELSNMVNCEKPVVIGSSRAKLWHHNCFQCHAGTVGKYVVGGAHANYSNQYTLSQELGLLSGFVDNKLPPPNGGGIFRPLKVAFTRLLSGMNKLEQESLDHFLDYARTELIPTFKWGKSAGDNMGPFTSYKGMGRLKPDGDGYRIYKRTEFSLTDSQVFEDDELFIPNVDAMPWWLLKFKRHVFWTGDNEVTKTPQFMYAFTFQHRGISSSHLPHAKRLGLALRYAEKLHSPAYPYSLDWALVEKGQKIFHSKPIVRRNGATCSSCHGSYEQTKKQSSHWKVRYPGKRLGVVNVGTDDTYAKVSKHITGGIQPLLAEARSAMQAKHGPAHEQIYGPRLAVARGRGVVPPPLVGLWASPPYFHNGSVPALYYVLKASKRPSVWKRPSPLLETSFDRKRVGFRFSVLAELNSFGNSERAADSRDELLLRNPVSRETSDRMLVYYTNDKGHGNSGHAFADDWPDEEIFAILEFLKSVSGPNVLPADPVKMGVRFSEGFKER